MTKKANFPRHGDDWSDNAAIIGALGGGILGGGLGAILPSKSRKRRILRALTMAGGGALSGGLAGYGVHRLNEASKDKELANKIILLDERYRYPDKLRQSLPPWPDYPSYHPPEKPKELLELDKEIDRVDAGYDRTNNALEELDIRDDYDRWKHKVDMRDIWFDRWNELWAKRAPIRDAYSRRRDKYRAEHDARVEVYNNLKKEYDRVAQELRRKINTADKDSLQALEDLLDIRNNSGFRNIAEMKPISTEYINSGYDTARKKGLGSLVSALAAAIATGSLPLVGRTRSRSKVVKDDNTDKSLKKSAGLTRQDIMDILADHGDPELGIGAGSAMVMRGLRDETDDIDADASTELFERLLQKYNQPEVGTSNMGTRMFTIPGTPVDVHEGDPVGESMDGVRVETPEQLLTFYNKLNRDKDQLSIQKLKEVLDKRADATKQALGINEPAVTKGTSAQREKHKARIRNIADMIVRTAHPKETKVAQTNNPSWLGSFIDRLWNRENTNKTGFDPDTGLWSPHTDPNGKTTLIGPGIKTEPGTTYTDAQMSNAVTNAVMDHYNKAKRLYPNLDQQSDNVQQLMTDITYAGGGNYPKLYNALTNRNAEAAQSEYKLHYTPAGSTNKVPITRRNDLNLREYLRPEIDSWNSAPVTNAVARARPLSPTAVARRAAAEADQKARQRALEDALQRLRQKRLTRSR